MGCPKRSSLKNWKGWEEGEYPRKDGKRKEKEIFKCWEWEDGESWWHIGKNGRTLFDRPKPTAGCSANGRRRRTEGADMVSLIKAQIIKWLCHVQRTDQARPTRKLLYWKPMGIRPVGRPRQWWQEDVTEDLKKVKVKNWKEIVKDRRTWRLARLDREGENPKRVAVPRRWHSTYLSCYHTPT